VVEPVETTERTTLYPTNLFNLENYLNLHGKV
jgi:hypothetical protein